MKVLNPEKIDKDKLYYCGKCVGSWFIKNGLPLFGQTEDKYIFIKTDEFYKMKENLPFLLKLFS